MAIRLTLSRTQKPLFCESKWWGDPDMPADMEYPMMKVDGEEDYPLTFVCQIRCEDIAGLDPEACFPRYCCILIQLPLHRQQDKSEYSHRSFILHEIKYTERKAEALYEMMNGIQFWILYK